MHLSRVAAVVLIAGAACGVVATPANAAVPKFCAVTANDSNSMICEASESALKSAWAARPNAPLTQYLIATLYDNANLDPSAGYLQVNATSDCTPSKSTVDVQIMDLGPTWRDRVSSFQTYGNCATRLWSGTSFGGTAFPSSTTYQVTSTYVGAAFNDKAESAQFS